DLTRKITLQLVPVGIDTERFDVYALLVHFAQTILCHHGLGIHAWSRAAQVRRFLNHAVRVYIHGLDAAAVDHDLTTPSAGLRVCLGSMHDIASRKDYAGFSAVPIWYMPFANAHCCSSS